MSSPESYHAQEESLDRQGLREHQDRRLQQMLEVLWKQNSFYRSKFQEHGWTRCPRVDEFERFPWTSKAELLEDAALHPPYGSNLTYPLSRYVRLHHTSGTQGRPLAVLDTLESWESWKQCWGLIYRAAGLEAGECIYVAFSFGPFVGFWAAFEAAPQLGLRVIPGGGRSSIERLHAIWEHRATVLVSTPSYALHLAEVARSEGMNPAAGPCRTAILAGEPGASIPATRSRIEELWGVRCFDHIGASEVGPYGFQCRHHPEGVHVNELDFVAESIDPETGAPVAPGRVGELVMTSLNRWGFPLIRYRTGDLVRFEPENRCPCGRAFRTLRGGILARRDEMISVRGVNLYPGALEAVVREFEEVAEFETRVFRRHELAEVCLRLELTPGAGESKTLPARLGRELHERLGLRIEVEVVPPGTLPRYELKARRFHLQ